METIRSQKNFFILLLIGGIVLMFFIILPYLEAIVLAATFGVLFYPLYERFLLWTEGSEATSSLLTILIILAFVFTPLIAIGAQVFQQASQLYATYTNGSGNIGDVLTQVETYLSQAFPFALPDIRSAIGQGASLIAGNLGKLFSSALNVILELFIMLILLYYIFKDGKKFAAYLERALPLEETYTRQIMGRLKTAINSVIKGSLLIALIQGVVSAIGFTLFGVPQPVLWGSIAAVAALIPSVGTAIVLAPAILFLYFSGAVSNAIGLLIWGVLAVGLIDNLLGPYLIERGVHIPPVFILLAVLGGVSFFGPVGFLLGPLVLSFVFALLDIYPSLFKKT